MTTPAPPRLLGLHEVALITRRNLRHVARTPRLASLAVVQPVLFLLLYLFVFGGAIATPGMSYVDYLMPAVVVQAILTGGTTAVAIAVDLEEGMVDRFRTLPIARSAVLTARAAADVARVGCVVLVLVLVGVAVGFGVHTDAWWVLGAYALTLAFAFGVSWFLIAVGLLVRDPETAQLAGISLLPLLFASSAFVPIETMPDWLQPIAEAQPVNVVVSALRAMTQGGDAAHWLWLALAWIVAVTAALIPISTMLFKRRDRP